jgi:prenyltransferase beta subunit
MIKEILNNMGLIVVKDFHIGHDIQCYMRISKFKFSLKDQKWDCQIDFYLDKNSVMWKKTNEYIKEWVLSNQEVITEDMWNYIENKYLNSDRNLMPIGTDSIFLDNILSPWDFQTENEIFEWVYEQIKINPNILKIKKIIEDVYDNKEDLIKPFLKEMNTLLKESKKNEVD